jgi:hypothetical protein
MVTARNIIDQCDRSCIVLSRDGAKLRAEVLFPDSHPLDPDLAALLRQHKEEVLAYVDFEEWADRLLLESTARIAKAWPKGCTALDTDSTWDELEARLHKAYWTMDPDRLREVVREREEYAVTVCASWRFGRANSETTP